MLNQVCTFAIIFVLNRTLLIQTLKVLIYYLAW